MERLFFRKLLCILHSEDFSKFTSLAHERSLCISCRHLVPEIFLTYVPVFFLNIPKTPVNDVIVPIILVPNIDEDNKNSFLEACCQQDSL